MNRTRTFGPACPRCKADETQRERNFGKEIKDGRWWCPACRYLWWPKDHEWAVVAFDAKRTAGLTDAPELAEVAATGARLAAIANDSPAGFDRQPDRCTGADGRETIDAIRDELGDEGFRAFCVGNALKYEARAGRKGDSVGDADKARWYRRMAAHVRGYGPDPRAGRPDFAPYCRPPSHG